VEIVLIFFGLSQPILNFDLFLFSDNNVCWWDATMNYSFLMKMRNALKQWKECISYFIFGVYIEVMSPSSIF